MFTQDNYMYNLKKKTGIKIINDVGKCQCVLVWMSKQQFSSVTASYVQVY